MGAFQPHDLKALPFARNNKIQLTRRFLSMPHKALQKYFAEAFGTALLLATVVGSGIMAERLAGGNVAIALLGNTIPTGAILIVLITTLGPVSGAHFNPAVSLVFRLRGGLSNRDFACYLVAQFLGGIAGVLLAHGMFDEALFQTSQKIRSGGPQWLAEAVATFGLIFVILATLKARETAVATMVGLYITAAYWFTASTSFANPAVTLARSFSDTFAGIRPIDVAPFVLVQFLAAVAASFLCKWLLAGPDKSAE